jgi:hypothetical protein
MALPTSETLLFTGQNVLIARPWARSLCNMISLSLSLSPFKVHTSSFLFSTQFSFTCQTGPPNFSSSVVQTANPVCVCAVILIFEEPWMGIQFFYFSRFTEKLCVSSGWFFDEEKAKSKNHWSNA